MNELLFVGAALIDLVIITAAARFGKTGLTLAITVNLILVSTFAPKLVEVFGLFTNIGNVFYGALFLASNIMIERFGKKAAVEAMWLSFSANIIFVTMGQFAIRTIGSDASAPVNNAIADLFAVTPQVALASVVAYLIVQYLNIKLYSRLKEYFEARHLGFRHIGSVSVAQTLDSALFFTIAFLGSLSSAAIFTAIIGGIVIKIGIACLSVPFIYIARAFAEESHVA